MDMGVCTEALGIGSSGDACVNVIHASPDAPAVDVYVDGAKALENLAFGKASGWVALPAGEHQVQVTATGGQPDQAVIDAKLTLEAGAAYEVAATGLLANIAPQIYQVNLSKLDENTARVRVIHTSPDAPAVDVAVKGGDVLISNLAFPNASDYLEVPAGSYDLEVRAAGTTTVALELPGVKLDPTMVYDVFAIGQLGDKTLTVLVVASSTTGAMATPEATASPSM
ncbi:MAG: cell wall anchor [Chloroflexota bacterium]